MKRKPLDLKELSKIDAFSSPGSANGAIAALIEEVKALKRQVKRPKFGGPIITGNSVFDISFESLPNSTASGDGTVQK